MFLPMAIDAASRIRGLIVGLAAGFERSFEDAAVAAAELALVEAVAVALTRTPVALEAMVERWIAVGRDRPVRPETRAALDRLAHAGVPPAPGAVPRSAGALVRFLPIAALAGDSAVNLVSGTYHLAALVDPDPETLWTAVAVNVAAARFLHGSKDFVPDAIEALRANDAPAPVLAALRRLPFETAAGVEALGLGTPLAAGYRALWVAHREPRPGPALARIAADDPGGWTLPLAAALVGARDGETAIRGAVPGGENLRVDVDPIARPLLSGRLAT
jgi:hypothetical protein